MCAGAVMCVQGAVVCAGGCDVCAGGCGVCAGGCGVCAGGCCLMGPSNPHQYQNTHLVCLLVAGHMSLRQAACMGLGPTIVCLCVLWPACEIMCTRWQSPSTCREISPLLPLHLVTYPPHYHTPGHPPSTPLVTHPPHLHTPDHLMYCTLLCCNLTLRCGEGGAIWSLTF